MLLHVASGHCTTTLIEQAAVPGRTMVWCDPLHEGPVPGNVSDEELLRVRAEFLASRSQSADRIAADLAGWRAAVDDWSSYDELILWFEHDLFDQLNLIQLLSHLGRRASHAKPVTLVSIDRHPAHPDFKGLGELTPGEIAALFQSRVPVTRDQVAVAQRAWAAFSSSERRDLEMVLTTDLAPLPFLATALERHLEEFPSVEDGLSRSERRLMQLTLDGPVELRRLWPRMHDGERAYYIADTTLVARVRELASSTPALLSISGARFQEPLSGTIALTEAGREVLEGRANRVALCGIDRWLGGVHLLKYDGGDERIGSRTVS